MERATDPAQELGQVLGVEAVDPPLEVRALDEAHGQEGQPSVDPCGVDWHEALQPADPRADLALDLEASHVDFFNQLRQEDLERYGPARRRLERAIDRAHAALPE